MLSYLETKFLIAAPYIKKSILRVLFNRREVPTRGFELCDIGGIKLKIDFSSPAQREIYMAGTFESEMTMLLRHMIEPNEVFVDVGANFGWHSLSLLINRPDVLMSYAYEPSPSVYSLLTENIRANNCQDRCHAKQLALSNKKGRSTLKTFEDLDSMYASLYPLADSSFQASEVDLDTLDCQTRQFVAPPTIIKCDVEGAERDVLMGATKLMSGELGKPPIWCLEVNYETSGMAGFFPWELLEIAARYAPYEGYYIRNKRILPMPNHKAVRHGEMLILAVPEVHHERLMRTNERVAQS